MNPNPTRHLLGLAALALASAPALGFASQAFPEDIKDELALSSKPDCTLCHRNNNGGNDTVKKPFGVELMQLGAQGKSRGTLLGALRTYDRERYSVDGDTAPDVQELREGSNPNEPDAVGEGGAAGVVPPGFDELPLPQTGCAVHRRSESTARRSGNDVLAPLVLGLALAIAYAVARRQRRPAV